MKKLICIFFSISISFSLYSQERLIFKKNAVSITAPAFTRLYSLNYERVLRQKNWICISNIGFYHLPIDESTKRLNAVFAGIDFLQGKKKSYLDLGANFVFDKQHLFTGNNDTRKIAVSLFPKVGFRYQPKPKSLFFRIIIMPFLIDISPRTALDYAEKRYFRYRASSTNYASFSVGYTF
jgi:hypothetical protein